MFSTCPKRQDKNLNILRTKSVFKMKFFMIFEGLPLQQIKKVFFEGECLTLKSKNTPSNFIKKVVFQNENIYMRFL